LTLGRALPTNCPNEINEIPKNPAALTRCFLKFVGIIWLTGAKNFTRFSHNTVARLIRRAYKENGTLRRVDACCKRLLSSQKSGQDCRALLANDRGLSYDFIDTWVQFTFSRGGKPS
jgi:hypothetical protein